MLLRFWVENYHGFKGRAEIDFTDKKNYLFGKECVRGDLLDKTILLGTNGAGKTNFGYALTDIVGTLYGYGKDIGQCNPRLFINGDSDSDLARFHYEFSFRGSVLVYEYSKSAPEDIVSESLTMDRAVIFSYDLADRSNDVFDTARVGAGKVDAGSADGRSAVLAAIWKVSGRSETSMVGSMMSFVARMHYYRSMWRFDEHIGVDVDPYDFVKYAADNGLAGELRSFLRDVDGIDIDIVAKEGGLYIHTAKRDLLFTEAASRGTVILCRLYCWLRRTKRKASLMFFDDFDDMYHYKPSMNAIRWIISGTDAQCIFVTNNTGLVSNDVFRPDCCFILENGKLESLASRTDKTLRRGHNLEKMLREGEFDKERVRGCRVSELSEGLIINQSQN